MAALTTIEGIGDTFATKLKAAGVGSIEKLLEAGSTRAGRKKLADASGLDGSRLLRFVNHADLMRISGIGGEMSELLEASGVDTVAALARRKAENLHKKMEETNAEKKLVRRTPTLAQVQGWIDQANALPRVVQY
jgi:predicted flap endonuclease-1-like 5' DNA nuclease